MDFEHEKALAEFTEAIRLEPDAPNPYIGRAMAHRRLGNDAAARQDEEQGRELGGPERNARERLSNRSHRRWGGDFDNPEWKREDPLSRNAALLSVLTRQIHNGGLWQWIANGYCRWIDDTIAAAREIGTTPALEVAAVLQDLSPHVDPKRLGSDLWDEESDAEVHQAAIDESGEQVAELEDRYHRVQMTFAHDMENWFEEKASQRH
jgi:hypothetical protein